MVALTLLGAAGCRSTQIETYLKENAPGYRPMLPPTAKDVRGLHLTNEDEAKLATNRCFDGHRDERGYAGQSVYKHSFDESYGGGAALARDFGSMFGLGEIGAGAALKFTGTLALEDIREYWMQDVFFDPAGPCAQGQRRLFTGEGVEYTVVTRMLQAGSVTLASTDGTHLDLSLAVTEFQGKLKTSTENSKTWAGTKIHFAFLPQRYRISLTENRRELRTGAGLELGGCVFTLRGFDPGRDLWKGRLTCEDGRNYDIDRQAADSIASIQTVQGGVSFGIRTHAVAGKPGLYAVDAARWIARAVMMND